MTFSIIIPVYNVAPYLRECLDSVLAQTYADWEAVCVDDGSTDGSGAILDEYAARDKRLRVVHQENAGVSSARNAGLNIARGEWVWFLDGDDLIASNSLELIGRHVDPNLQVDVVRVPFICFEGTLPMVGLEDNAAHMVTANASVCAPHMFFGASQFGCFRRSVIDGLFFEPYRWLEDILFTIQALKHCRNLIIFERPLYYYRQRTGSAVHSRRTVDEMRSIFECQRRIFDEISNWAQVDGSCSFDQVWKKFHILAYYTFFGQYFEMSPKDRGVLLDEWLGLQQLLVGKYRIPYEWRLRIALVKFFHSGYLVKPIVLLGHTWRARASGILQKLRGIRP